MGQKIIRTIIIDSVESLSNRKCDLSPSLLQGIELISSLTEMEGFAAIEIICSHIKKQASSKQFTVLITVPAY